MKKNHWAYWLLGAGLLALFLLSFHLHYTAEIEMVRETAIQQARKNAKLEHYNEDAARIKEMESMQQHIDKLIAEKEAWPE